jgi:hypothetical protein
LGPHWLGFGRGDSRDLENPILGIWKPSFSGFENPVDLDLYIRVSIPIFAGRF